MRTLLEHIVFPVLEVKRISLSWFLVSWLRRVLCVPRELQAKFMARLLANKKSFQYCTRALNFSYLKWRRAQWNLLPSMSDGFPSRNIFRNAKRNLGFSYHPSWKRSVRKLKSWHDMTLGWKWGAFSEVDWMDTWMSTWQTHSCFVFVFPGLRWSRRNLPKPI